MIDNTSKVTYLPDSPVPPGETLRETLESLGMKQVELAKRMNRPVKTINEIIHSGWDFLRILSSGISWAYSYGSHP